MDKLPEEICLIISRKYKDNFDLTELVEAAKLEIEARERCRIAHSDSSKEKQTEGYRKSKFQQSTGSALVSGEGQTRPSKCLFAKEITGHPIVHMLQRLMTERHIYENKDGVLFVYVVGIILREIVRRR